MTTVAAFGSSGPAAKTPRGRWCLKLRPITRTPFAITPTWSRLGASGSTPPTLTRPCVGFRLYTPQ